jgi:hypothetical protein
VTTEGPLAFAVIHSRPADRRQTAQEKGISMRGWGGGEAMGYQQAGSTHQGITRWHMHECTTCPHAAPPVPATADTLLTGPS